jgi:hypothetical protein
MLAWRRVSIQQSSSREQDPWSAETALRGTVVDDRLLYWVKPIIFGKTFHGCDVSAFGFHCEHQTGVDRFTVHKYGAGSTLAC